MYRYQDAFPAVQPVGGRDDLSVEFNINSVRVENPSGMWLYLQQASRFIAPYTVATMVVIPVPTKTLVVQYVAAPVGGVASVAVGGPLRITMYEDAQVENVGVDYSLVPTLQTLDADIVALTAVLDGLRGGTAQAGSLTNDQVNSIVDASGAPSVAVAPVAVGTSIYITHLSWVWSTASVAMIAAGDIYNLTAQASVSGIVRYVTGVDLYHASNDIDFSNPIRIGDAEGLQFVMSPNFGGAATEAIDYCVEYYVA